MASFHPASLVDSVDPESIRVHAPSTIVFLCGGAIDPTGSPPTMLRDAYYRVVRAAGSPYKIILAEDANPLSANANYKDLFSFESDIAQVVGLILLFAESPGSLAELGAFAALQSVAPRLLAVVDDHYYAQKSFIRNGPIAYLENDYGDEWILVLDRNETGISEGGKILNLDTAILFSSVDTAVKKRLGNLSAWTVFDKRNSGHAILLITGLCQTFGALTKTEIKTFSTKLKVEQIRFENYVYCAELLGWIKKIRKGNNIFYVGTPIDVAIDYRMTPGIGSQDKLRWRADIRAFWKANDSARHRAIIEVAESTASNL